MDKLTEGLSNLSYWLENRDDTELEREIVPVEEWLEDKYYTGPIAESLWDFWKEEFTEFWTGDYNEWLVDGSKGVGKTFGSLLCPIRHTYELSCYKTPQHLFDFNRTSNLLFMYLNITKQTAKKAGWDEWFSIVEEIPYFNEEFPYDDEYSTELQFPKHIRGGFGASDSDIISTNLLGVIIDEANFFRKGGGSPGDLEEVRRVYNDAIERRRNRFMEDGDDPGWGVVISSATHDKSFMEKRKKKSGSKTYYTRAVRYKVHPHRFSDKTFWVFTGSEENPVRVMDDMQDYREVVEFIDSTYETEEGNLEDAILNAPPEIQGYFEEVPDDFEEQFRWDPVSSLQSIAGIAVGASGNFFMDRRSWNECKIEKAIPFSSREIVVSSKDERTLDYYFRPKQICEFKESQQKKVRDQFEEDRLTRDQREGYWLPRQNSGRTRYVHLDMATNTDPAALCMSHIDHIKKRGSGIETPHIVTDLMIRILPPSKPAQIDHDKILDFIWRLKHVYNFPIKVVTMDKHTSESNIMRIKKNIIDEEAGEQSFRLSTDSDDEMWRDVKGLIHSKSMDIISYDILEEEWFNLRWDKEESKVDHPDKFPNGDTGHNDVSCAFVGSVYNAMNSDEKVRERYNVSKNPKSTRKKTRSQMQKEWEDSHGNKPFKSRKSMRKEALAKRAFRRRHS